jgi:hypothetical protein
MTPRSWLALSERRMGKQPWLRRIRRSTPTLRRTCMVLRKRFAEMSPTALGRLGVARVSRVTERWALVSACSATCLLHGGLLWGPVAAHCPALNAIVAVSGPPCTSPAPSCVTARNATRATLRMRDDLRTGQGPRRPRSCSATPDQPVRPLLVPLAKARSRVREPVLERPHIEAGWPCDRHCRQGRSVGFNALRPIRDGRAHPFSALVATQ